LHAGDARVQEQARPVRATLRRGLGTHVCPPKGLIPEYLRRGSGLRASVPRVSGPRTAICSFLSAEDTKRVDLNPNAAARRPGRVYYPPAAMNLYSPTLRIRSSLTLLCWCLTLPTARAAASSPGRGAGRPGTAPHSVRGQGGSRGRTRSCS